MSHLNKLEASKRSGDLLDVFNSVVEERYNKKRKLLEDLKAAKGTDSEAEIRSRLGCLQMQTNCRFGAHGLTWDELQSRRKQE